jgi:hypothetical protein
MMTARYRIVETAAGGYRLGELKNPNQPDQWTAMCPDSFRSLSDAMDGLRRVLAQRIWYYDEEGNPLTPERDF